jgi:acetyltransferase
MSRLEYFFRPGSVAVIGASRKEGSLGKMFIDAIRQLPFSGKIYPVNPNAESINGITCYPDIKSLPEIPDLVIILLPSHLVSVTMKELGQAGIKNVIEISAGFREIGEEGRKREEEIIGIARLHDMRILGPNCMGIFNTDIRVQFNGTFSPIPPNKGRVAFISQSGALGVGVLELSKNSDLGFSVFASTGNKADIGETDILDFLHQDQNSAVIMMYLESINTPVSFRKVCGQIAAVKPILAVKAGYTESGIRAASSHTGALANPDYIIDGFLKQSGVLRFDNLKEMIDSARALSQQPLPDGPRTAIVTNAGGPSILASDALEKAGLRLAQLKPVTIEKLKSILPEEASTGNPIDMIASATHDTYYDVMETVLQDDGVDNVILIIVRPPVDTDPKRIIENLEPLLQNCGKPILSVLMSRKDEYDGLECFRKLQIPVYLYPEPAVNAMGSMWKYHQIQQRFRKSEAIVIHPELEEPLVSETLGESRQVPVDKLFELLEHYDISTVPWILSDSFEDILEFHKKQDAPVVLKIANEQIIHKSDAGLVHMDLNTESAIRQAFQDIIQSAVQELPDRVTPTVLA